MSLILETVQTEGIAALSYLLGDDKTGSAAVIDPRPDVEIYVDLARKRKVAITHVFETHIHADLMSGARELADRVGTAKVYLSKEGKAKYDFEHESIKDGAKYDFGDLVLTARHTPGHTPEHMSFEAAEQKHAPKPWGVSRATRSLSILPDGPTSWATTKRRIWRRRNLRRLPRTT